jgi:hypothetical protein
MNIPIFYSLKTGLIKSWIVPSDEKESALINLKPQAGDGVLVISEKEYGSIDTLQSLVTKATGLAPVYQRYAVVDKTTGDVLTAIVATEDTVIDGATLVPSPDAREGWKMIAPDTFVNLNPPDPPKVTATAIEETP